MNFLFEVWYEFLQCRELVSWYDVLCYRNYSGFLHWFSHWDCLNTSTGSGHDLVGCDRHGLTKGGDRGQGAGLGLAKDSRPRQGAPEDVGGRQGAGSKPTE
jgi:hypothetical protein